jgi:hypothetical protein
MCKSLEQDYKGSFEQCLDRRTAKIFIFSEVGRWLPELKDGPLQLPPPHGPEASETTLGHPYPSSQIFPFWHVVIFAPRKHVPFGEHFQERPVGTV